MRSSSVNPFQSKSFQKSQTRGLSAYPRAVMRVKPEASERSRRRGHYDKADALLLLLFKVKKTNRMVDASVSCKNERMYLRLNNPTRKFQITIVKFPPTSPANNHADSLEKI